MSPVPDLPQYWRAWNERLEKELAGILPPADAMPEDLHQAMRYSTLDGGKRLRGFLVIAAAEACGGDGERVLPLACALESIHAYSLIHDDLPCMDDDDFRRGKPSCHRAFGEAVAVLAGDALLTESFGMLASERALAGAAPELILLVVGEVAAAAGSLGMVAGQALDLAAEGRSLVLSQLQTIHQRKTGALIRVAARGGAVLAGAGPDELAALTEYAEQLGLAFQITDDLLDVTGDAGKLGKPVHHDCEAGKATYPGLLGVEGARNEALAAIRRAKSSLVPFGERGRYLRDLADFVLARER